MQKSKLALKTLATLLAFAACGCASWTERGVDPDGQAKLPEINENKRSLALTVEFVPIEEDKVTADDIQSLWQWTDETAFDLELRRRLSANGLRVGRIVKEERFRSRLKQMRTQENVLDNFLTQADVASEVSHGGRRIPMRIGRRYELPVRQPIEGTHVSMIKLGEKLIGKTLLDPQFLFAVTPTTGDSSRQVRIQFRPEIQHGSMRQRWVSSDTALRIDTRRETWSLPELDIELEGVKNDIFVIGSTMPRIGLAKQMLTGKSSENTQQQVLMLVTLSHVPTPADRL